MKNQVLFPIFSYIVTIFITPWTNLRIYCAVYTNIQRKQASDPFLRAGPETEAVQKAEL